MENGVVTADADVLPFKRSGLRGRLLRRAKTANTQYNNAILFGGCLHLVLLSLTVNLPVSLVYPSAGSNGLSMESKALATARL